MQSSKFIETFSSEYSARKIKDALLSKRKMNYQKAYNSLMYFENKRRKVHKEKIIFYTLSRINEEKKMLTIHFKVRKGSNIRIESNGLKEAKDIKLDYTNAFQTKFNYSVKNFYIKVYNINADEYFTFVSSNQDKDREYGLLVKNKKKLVYYNYVELNTMNKIKYIIFHNPKKILRKVGRK